MGLAGTATGRQVARLCARVAGVEAVTQPHLETIDSDQCAELLRCTPGQVEEMARAGEIPGLKIGRGWLFVRADLRVALDAYRRVISEKP